MRVGINGMGRIGRLALRAALGGVDRPPDDPRAAVTDDTLLKIYAWYDNEVAYACRMVDLANIVMQRGV